MSLLKESKKGIIREIPKNLSQTFLLLTKISDDIFEEGRQDVHPQERDFNHFENRGN